MKVTTDGCLFGAWCAEGMRKAEEANAALDIGTGTGLLSLMVAQKNNVPIEAIEIDAEAVQQAVENVGVSPWKDGISVINANLLLWESSKQYDWIFSNPPFYESDLRSDKQGKNMAHHDAALTLSELFRHTKQKLKDDGVFFFLLPAKREKEIEQLLQFQQLYLHKKILVRQTPRHQPFRMMIQGGKGQGNLVAGEIVIKDEEDRYTPAFVQLLKDYYLHL